MSAFYDLASLVLVPSGYKASKVYAQKPLTTDGQLSFSRASTATRVNASGLIEEVASNVPRLDYLGSSCPRLLLEPQRTNLLTYSEQFDNAAWTKNVSVTANAIASPDGYTNADKLVENASNVNQWAYQTLTLTGAQTFSVYAKKGERDFVALATAGVDVCYFNLNTGVVVSTSAGATASIINVGNGWYRCVVTAASAAGIYAIVAVSDNGSRIGYAGDITKGIYLWGAQQEAGAYATSYIPTLGSASTRGSDAASKTGISSLIGQTEGTLFADITIPTMANTGANLVSMSLFNSGLTAFTGLDIYDSGDLLGLHVNGTTQASILKTGFTAGRHKIAFGYKANDFVLYVDGALVGTDTSGTVGAQDSFGLQYGTSQFIGQQYVNQALVFPTRLTNAQLAELTAL